MMIVMMLKQQRWLLVVVAVVVLRSKMISCQMESPCPRLFAYETQTETDRWFGVVTLISKTDLSGVWLRLIFDRPALQLGNWFGEIKTMDNKEFLIKNRNHKLVANMPYALRFYIQYDPAAGPAPKLIAFRLNANTVCPEGQSTTEAAFTGGQLQTSGVLSGGVGDSVVTTPSTTIATGQTQSTFSRPGGGWNRPSVTAEDDDDVFIGDLQLISRPHLRPMVQEFECGTVVTPQSRERRRRKRRHVYAYENYILYKLDNHGQYVPIHYPNYYERYILNVLLRNIYNNNNNNERDDYHWHNHGNNEEDRDDVVDNDDEQIAPIEQQPRPLITYGQATREGEFPWHAALYLERGADLQYICGGSLISRQHVITVAHCVTRRSNRHTINPDSLIIYLGKYYLKKWGNPGIQDCQVSAIYAHPDYSQNYANDIAVIKLTNPVQITDYVRPICLWGDEKDVSAVLNKQGTVVGWGFDESGKVTEELTQAKMPVVAKDTCIYSFPDFFAKFTTDKTFCAGFRNGTSVCNGDSGGGMVFQRANSTPMRPIWQLRGLVSISVALQNQFKCDASHYVVFTDVAKYLGWIEEQLKK